MRTSSEAKSLEEKLLAANRRLMPDTNGGGQGRFLLHVLPNGFQRIRHYGLLSNQHRAENLARCLELLNMASLIPQPQQNYRERYQQLTGHDLLLRPHCSSRHMVRIGVPRRALRQ